jgi:hypothetical protein
MNKQEDEKFQRHLQALLSQYRQETGLTVPTLEKRAREAKQQKNNSVIDKKRK